jgi:hypothetical protein
MACDWYDSYYVAGANGIPSVGDDHEVGTGRERLQQFGNSGSRHIAGPQ